jgi:Glycosyltransferase like family 2
VPPSLSIVVVAYDMARELPRTLRTLSPEYQRGVDPSDYEMIVVDNGSPEPVDGMPAVSSGTVRSARLDPAPPSPARAANLGLEMAEGDLVGLIVDGARMASPGLLHHARLATGLAARPIIATLGWHLGSVRHMDAAESHDQTTEDRLLAEVDWESDGYRLFEIATLAASSSRGWFAPMGESSALFMPKESWTELGGLDERFSLPGGGLVNHDLYHRACELDGVQLVVLLGQGTFHQIHGGAATSRQVTWEVMQRDYESIRGRRYQPPPAEALYLGTAPPQTWPHLEHSARLAMERRKRLQANQP